MGEKSIIDRLWNLNSFRISNWVGWLESSGMRTSCQLLVVSWLKFLDDVEHELLVNPIARPKLVRQILFNDGIGEDFF